MSLQKYIMNNNANNDACHRINNPNMLNKDWLLHRARYMNCFLEYDVYIHGDDNNKSNSNDSDNDDDNNI